MTDHRPPPRYGEYAPLEPTAPPDRAAPGDSGTPPDRAAPADSGTPPDRAAPAASSSVTVKSTAAERSGSALAASAGTRERPLWDTLVTSILLALGTFDVVNSWPQVADFTSALNTLYAAQGIGTFTSAALAATMGLVANIVRLVILLAVIAISLVRIHLRKRAFPVPIIGAVAAGIVLIAFVAVLMLNDPAMVAYLHSRGA